MVGSVDSLDFIPDLSMSKETNVIPIDCWQDVNLGKIWIPDYLLPSRKKLSDARTTKGIFHTLQKREDIKQINSFSVYSTSDDENAPEDIFLSDSDEDDLDTFICKTIESSVKISPEIASARNDDSTSLSDMKRNDISNLRFCKNRHLENIEKIDNTSKLKSLPSLNNLSSIDTEETTKSCKINNNLNHSNKCNLSIDNYSMKKTTVMKNTYKSLENSSEIHKKSTYDKIVNIDKIQNLKEKGQSSDSHISLHEILDNTTEANIQDFMYEFPRKNEKVHSNMPESMVETMGKRNKKDKRKKKVLKKSVTLDEFLEDYDEEDRQEDYCNDYLRKVLNEQNKSNEVQVASTKEFPKLIKKPIHSDQLEINAELRTKTFKEMLTESIEINKTQTPDVYETVSGIASSSETTETIVIENIPCEVCHEDVYAILCGYGEIKDFSLQPHGHFLKAVVTLDLMADIDWIIDCLNGSEPFGASSRMLKCYKQQ